MLERLVDQAALELGIDRIELRRRNVIRSWPHRAPLGFVYDSGDYERCLDVALELLEDADAARERTVVGTGVALYVERAGGQWESAEIELGADGRFLVRPSSSPHGQGHDTTFAQIAADRLGVAIESVSMRFGDSADGPAGVGTFGSRSVAVAGSAVAVACERLVEVGCERAAELLGCERDGVRFNEGRFGCDDGDGRSVTWAELAPLRAEARFDSELVFSSGAHAAAVAIDRATGALRVLRIAAVDDAGTLINPLLAHGQVLGGVVQALGECLVEEVIHDETGQNRSGSLMDYSLLTAAEIPPILTGEVASPSPHNPLGAKGAGEGGAVGALPAIANAVVDALGGIHLDPPYSEEKLWQALRRDGADRGLAAPDPTTEEVR